jgi:hypothetical protein
LQEETNKKFQEASAKITQAEKDFAKKYNVNLVEQKSELGEKLEIADKLNHYINLVYILFFKCNWEEGQLTTALNNKKITQAEQARNALVAYADEGLKALSSDSIKAFQHDPSLAQQCKTTLLFYKNMGEKEAPKMLDFFLKSENFEKIKKAMDAKSSHTKAEVDDYNKAVKEMNNSANTFNQTNQNLNNQKTQMLNDWDAAEKKFVDTYMPYYRK